MKGGVKRNVKKATKKGNDFNGSLAESNRIMKVPTAGVMDDVIDSVNDTKASQKENGGHSMIGDSNATRWDEGPTPKAIKDSNGNVIGAEASIVPFIVNGVRQYPTIRDMEFWWHTHPDVMVEGIPLGSSTPSFNDKMVQRDMKEKGFFKGNTFVIGVGTKKVTFYNSKKPLMTIKYSDFKKMGGK